VEGGDQLVVERVETAPGKALRLGEERGEVDTEHRFPSARAQHVGRALPLVDRQREGSQHAVEQLDTAEPVAAEASLALISFVPEFRQTRRKVPPDGIG
jgi:hypothetical protein